MNSQLKDLYAQINNRSSPIRQDELVDGELTYCKAIWAVGQWNVTSAYFELMSELEKLCKQKAIIYKRAEEVGPNDGLLHWTLFQLHTFPVIAERDAHTTFELESNIIHTTLYTRPRLHISFTGISKSTHGLFLCGFPSWNVNELRDELRTALCKSGIEYNEPHPQDICHATLLRLVDNLIPSEQSQLDIIINKYRNINLIEFIPEKWEFGFGTWRQTDSERKVLESWPAVPYWILHRGLSCGPDKTLENKEDNLWKQLHNGWDIECDIWFINEEWWLGHDEPSMKLHNVALLSHPHAWIHCKHLPALVECMRRVSEGCRINCFFHDSDVATLTSQGYIWTYPGNIIYDSHAICVMPERHGYRLYNILQSGGVCSDYLPKWFI